VDSPSEWLIRCPEDEAASESDLVKKAPVKPYIPLVHSHKGSRNKTLISNSLSLLIYLRNYILTYLLQMP